MKMGIEPLLLSQPQSHLFARVWRHIQADNCLDLAAQISFFFSLSLLPFCLVLAVIVGWLPSTLLWKSFATWIVTYLPADSQHLIFSTILGLVSYPSGFLSFGVITAIWSASAGFVSLMESLSVVHGGTESRSYGRKHAIAACVTLLATAVALATFGLLAFGRWGSHWFSLEIKQYVLFWIVWQLGRWIVTIAVLCLVIDLINFLLPDIKRPWRWLTPGTTLVVITLLALSTCFNVYFRHFSLYPRIYGTLGGFIILMLWIYIASLTVLIGAEIDRVIDAPTDEARAE